MSQNTTAFTHRRGISIPFQKMELNDIAVGRGQKWIEEIKCTQYIILGKMDSNRVFALDKETVSCLLQALSVRRRIIDQMITTNLNISCIYTNDH